MNKVYSAFFTLLVFINSTAAAEGLLAGTYTCKIAGASSISDGRGSSVRYLSGKLVVSEDDKITLNARAIFRVKGRKPEVETLNVSGSGSLNSYEEEDGDATAKASFNIKPSKRVVYRRQNLTGRVSANLSLNSNPLFEVQSASATVNTPIGPFGLICVVK